MALYFDENVTLIMECLYDTHVRRCPDIVLVEEVHIQADVFCSAVSDTS